MKAVATTVTDALIREDSGDAVDEALNLFRANVHFRSFDVRSGSDRLLVYLTLFIHQVRRIVKMRLTACSKSQHCDATILNLIYLFVCTSHCST